MFSHPPLSGCPVPPAGLLSEIRAEMAQRRTIPLEVRGSPRNWRRKATLRHRPRSRTLKHVLSYRSPVAQVPWRAVMALLPTETSSLERDFGGQSGAASGVALSSCIC